MNIEAHESISGILNELYERCRLTEDQRQDYDQRIAKALWRDRAEVIKAITDEGETSET